MYTRDDFSTRSHHRGKDREVLADDVQARLAPSETVLREGANYTTSSGQQPSSGRTPTDAMPVGFISHGSSSGSSPQSETPKNPVDILRDNRKRLSEAQEEPEEPMSTPAITPSSSTDSFWSAESSMRPQANAFCDIEREQEAISQNQGSAPRFPGQDDFPGLSIDILERVIDVDVRNCVIILHDHPNTGPSLRSLALRLQKELPESVFITVQPSQTSFYNTKGGISSHQGEVGEGESCIGFLRESRTILVDIIQRDLIGKCHFSPRHIILFGHGQGGTAALEAAASRKDIEFGGAISVGGAMPASAPDPCTSKARTPVLVLGSVLGSINDAAIRRIREYFRQVEYDIRPLSNFDISKAEDIAVLLDFFAHRLRGEEWTKEAVISFDGGGIRSYGSLLILQALMNTIGEEEETLDPTIESSFAPSEYKPMLKKSTTYSDNSEADDVVATPTQGLPYSSLFLPCHYFTYAAGTGTGGLISIMLSRFRMSVDDCIKEYKMLGAKVFGNPRPLAQGAILWHKFDCRTLKTTMRDITQRYSEPGLLGELYAMHEDVCKCMVLAYADNGGADFPFAFRTYQTHASLKRSMSTGRSHTKGTDGDAVALPIHQIARATSAAPTYFRPIEIQKSNQPGVLTFKDGGFDSHNPSEIAYYDIIDKHGGKGPKMGPFISIGTGTPIENLNNALNTLKEAFTLPSRTFGAHRSVEWHSMYDRKQNRFPYFRFDGGEGLGEIALDEWKGHQFSWLTGKDKKTGCTTLEKISVATAAYLAEPKVQQDLRDCARILVKRRHLRMRDSSEWDRYASFSYYNCNVQGCDRPRSNKANDFREHLRKFHQKITEREITEQEMEQRVRECRRVYWKYRPNAPDPTLPAG